MKWATASVTLLTSICSFSALSMPMYSISHYDGVAQTRSFTSNSDGDSIALDSNAVNYVGDGVHIIEDTNRRQLRTQVINEEGVVAGTYWDDLTLGIYAFAYDHGDFYAQPPVGTDRMEVNDLSDSNLVIGTFYGVDLLDVPGFENYGGYVWDVASNEAKDINDLIIQDLGGMFYDVNNIFFDHSDDSIVFSGKFAADGISLRSVLPDYQTYRLSIVAAVSEPAQIVLLVCGFAFLLNMRRSRA